MREQKVKTTCSCGGGLGANHCYRMEATGELIPKDFREDWNTTVCTVNGYTITKYTLINQRLYHLHENGVWSLPKDKSSTISIGDEW